MFLDCAPANGRSCRTRLCGRKYLACIFDGFPNRRLIEFCVTGIREPDMLTGMTEGDWLIALEVFEAVQSSRGEPGRDDRKCWRRTWQLEQLIEAVPAPQPVWCLRGILSDARGTQRGGAFI